MGDTMGGVVRNGVVVPDQVLPEGVRVVISVPTPLEFTPEEREEFESWNRASDKPLDLVERLAGEEPDEAR